MRINTVSITLDEELEHRRILGESLAIAFPKAME